MFKKTVLKNNVLKKIDHELQQAMALKKCRRCGCFQNTVNTLKLSKTINEPLKLLLNEACALYEQRRYDCLGCDICWPSVAQNLAAELDPDIAEGSHCATEEPKPQDGWPPLPGDYQVLKFQAPIAVCTLNSDHLIKKLSCPDITGVSIVGSLHTENLGIEHLIRNILTNPHIRFLILCGEDTQKSIGHLPGQSLLALVEYGVDENMRIIKAKGKRPFLKNISLEHIQAFCQQISVIEAIGQTDLSAIKKLIRKTEVKVPEIFYGTPLDIDSIPTEKTNESTRLILDPKGYFVVYPDKIKRVLVLEHYTNKGVLSRIFSATSASSLYLTVIEEALISRLDHAAYLGRELTRAELSLESDMDYVQDRAPGDVEITSITLTKAGKTCDC